jgi:excisionase family DNA binding protein
MTGALLTADEAAARIGCCVKTLGRLRRSGALAYYKTAARGYRYSAADCEAYLAACRTVGHPSQPTQHKRTARVTPIGAHPRFTERHP